MSAVSIILAFDPQRQPPFVIIADEGCAKLREGQRTNSYRVSKSGSPSRGKLRAEAAHRAARIIRLTNFLPAVIQAILQTKLAEEFVAHVIGDYPVDNIADMPADIVAERVNAFPVDDPGKEEEHHVPCCETCIASHDYEVSRSRGLY